MILNFEDKIEGCACGREHKMDTKLIVIEKDCLLKFNHYLACAKLEGDCLAIYDSNTYNAVGLVRPKVAEEFVLDAENLHASEKAVALVLENVHQNIKIIVAVGAGTIHDIGRYCANELGLKFVSCPTASSVDGFCSSVCAMTWKGSKVTMSAVSPSMVLADLTVIRQAPLMLAKSGIGDILGKYIALADWKIANLLSGEYYCEYVARIMSKAVETVKQFILSEQCLDETFYEKLTYALLLSGLAMQMVGNSRPASGAEHHIAHLIELEPQNLGIKNHALHGERVGVGTILISELYHNLAKSSDPFDKALNLDERCKKEADDVFGENLARAFDKENENNCILKLKLLDLVGNWAKIKQIINEIPSKDDLVELYEKLDLYDCLEDLQISSDKKNEILFLSTYVRNRLTLAKVFLMR